MTEPGSKEKLRICLIGPSYPYRGGISHYNSCLALELRRRHLVHMVNYSRLYPEFLFPGKTQYDESDSPLEMESERIIDSINPFTWVRTGFHVARFRPDLTIVQWWHPYFAPALSKICSILRILGKGKIIYICHNVVPHEKSVPDRILSRLAFSTGHGFIVQSNQDREDLLSLRSTAEVAAHPHPIYDFFRTEGDSTSRERAREKLGITSPNLLLFFGYIRPYKGLKYLLRAMRRIVGKIDAHLLVVGEFYDDSGPYRKLIREEGIQERVTLVDRYVDNEEVEIFFAASDLVVLPYISATQSGIAQIALAFDRPVVVTGVGGLPEVVSEGRTGFVVPPADSGEIASAVVRFFEEGWAERMAPHFEKEKERFSWGGMADEIEKLYLRISGG
ncbi:MAG: glycosyltransferase [Candidatus Latescibacteria bacterium]|nr:glycosyltransferase [bacterium]MBD3425489.1 glycosyltransferase [Candidatus Latescibacterota bacterium]